MATNAQESGLFDWAVMEETAAVGTEYTLFDETLRDGIQAPYVPNPPIEVKLRLVDLMVNAGVRAADLGFPGASAEARRDCTALAKHVVSHRLPLQVAFAGRTAAADIAAICDVAQEAQCEVDAYAFTGSSPIRQAVEGWTLDEISNRIVESAEHCFKGGVNFVLVLEDTTRCTPETLTHIYGTAADLGVERIALCDTVGAASPRSTRALIRWSKQWFESRGQSVKFDWHGHNDRGLAVSNSLEAIEAGCDRVHGTALGVGERAGNAAIDQLILNRRLQFGDNFDLYALREYCESVSHLLDQPIPVNYPAMGSEVFKTSAGVHAAAILKARKAGNRQLMDDVYSSVPASELGRQQEVGIDWASGASNVEFWMMQHGHPVDSEAVSRVLTFVKRAARPVSNEEIGRLVAAAA
jgi:2-isopropylmalate synthase